MSLFYKDGLWTFSPLDPGSPGGPGSPSPPRCPLGPGSPFVMLLPGGPGGPWVPVGPRGPIGPVFPFVPLNPATPFSPFWPRMLKVTSYKIKPFFNSFIFQNQKRYPMHSMAALAKNFNNKKGSLCYQSRFIYSYVIIHKAFPSL